MKTTTMSSLISVAPTFAESEPHTTHPAVATRRFGTIALFLALVGGVALGSAGISQATTIAREVAVARSSLSLALHGAYNGNYRYGASAEYTGRFSPEQLQQPFPPAWAWEQAGIRPL
jgi:hypothetical protein